MKVAVLSVAPKTREALILHAIRFVLRTLSDIVDRKIASL